MFKPHNDIDGVQEETNERGDAFFMLCFIGTGHVECTVTDRAFTEKALSDIVEQQREKLVL